MGGGDQREGRGRAEEDPHRCRAVEESLRRHHHDRQFNNRYKRQEHGGEPVDVDEVATAEPLAELEGHLRTAHPEPGDRQAGDQRHQQGDHRRGARGRRAPSAVETAVYVERRCQGGKNRRGQRRHERNVMAVEIHRRPPCIRRPTTSRLRSSGRVPSQSIHASSAPPSRSRSLQMGPMTNRDSTISSNPRSRATR